MEPTALLKHEILETIEDCINILSRGDDYEYIENKERLESARRLLKASKIHFKPVIEDMTFH